MQIATAVEGGAFELSLSPSLPQSVTTGGLLRERRQSTTQSIGMKPLQWWITNPPDEDADDDLSLPERRARQAIEFRSLQKKGVKTPNSGPEGRGGMEVEEDERRGGEVMEESRGATVHPHEQSSDDSKAVLGLRVKFGSLSSIMADRYDIVEKKISRLREKW
jgi:hypothetical protein